MRKMIVGAGACLLLVSSGCMSAYNHRQMALRQDREICSRYGADYNSPVYADCLALQDQTRETATAQQNVIAARNDAIVANRQ